MGCLIMVSYSGADLVLVSYLVAFTLILAFTNILEGVSMSALSKVMPTSLAKGTFNAGALPSSWFLVKIAMLQVPLRCSFCRIQLLSVLEAQESSML